jgi:hypothetical protein
MEKQRTEWRGERWYLYRDYFRNRKGQLLHREKYKDAFGPVPDDWDVHHIDGDKTNNELSNLVAISRRDHLREHGPRGFQLWNSDQRSEATSKHVWGKRQPVAVICQICGVEFQSIGMRTKNCGPNCRAKAFRAANPGYYSGRRKKR